MVWIYAKDPACLVAVKSCVSHTYHLLDQSIEGVHSKKWVGSAEEQSLTCRA